MSRTITLPDELYTRLEQSARQKGLVGVEQLLETWQASEEEKANRRQAVAQVDALRAKLQDTYGEMPDSVGLVQEDRLR